MARLVCNADNEIVAVYSTKPTKKSHFPKVVFAGMVAGVLGFALTYVLIFLFITL